jgi:hydroxymethylbilane synthase
VLACAGLDRLGRTEHVHQRFSVDELTPAPGQGALGLETRSTHPSASGADAERDTFVYDAVRSLNDPAAEFAVDAERAVLADLGGGCQLPLGAFCHRVDDHYHLHAMVVAPDGEQVIHVLKKAPVGIAAADLGHSVAEELKARGAVELLSQPA